MTLVLTGQRRSEPAQPTVGHWALDGTAPHAVLYAADEMHRQGSGIPLRRDFAADASAWMSDRLRCARDKARRKIGTSGAAAFPIRLAADASLPDLPLDAEPQSIKEDAQATGTDGQLTDGGRSLHDCLHPNPAIPVNRIQSLTMR